MEAVGLIILSLPWVAIVDEMIEDHRKHGKLVFKGTADPRGD